MKLWEHFLFGLFIAICIAFLFGILWMVGTISTNELRLNQ